MHKGGAEALASLEAKHGKLPETRTADTGGGGVHHLFKYPGFPVKNSTAEMGPGLDIKGEGGSIVVAPSLHTSGKRYSWKNTAPIADAPEWFLRLLREAQKSRANGSAAIGVAIPEGQLSLMRSVTHSSTKESTPRAPVFLKDEGTENENDLFSIFFQPSCFDAAAHRRIATPKMKTIVTARIQIPKRSMKSLSLLSTTLGLAIIPGDGIA